MKKHTVGTFPKSNRKLVERGKIITSNTPPLTFLTWYFNKKWWDETSFRGPKPPLLVK